MSCWLQAGEGSSATEVCARLNNLDKPIAEETLQGKPLTRRCVLVTRARHQASQLAVELERLGAQTILIPTIEIAPPESFEPLDAALRDIAKFQWLVVTSANAVEVFGERLAVAGITAARLQNVGTRSLKIAAVGPSTARAVEQLGLKVDVMPQQFVAESLAEDLGSRVAGSRVLLVRAQVARDVLPEALAAAGAVVEMVEAYRNIVPAESITEIRRVFEGPAPDAVTFTSSSSARNFFALLDEAKCSLPGGMKLVSIGPVTSATLRELGQRVDAEAQEATIPGLALAVAQCW